jgi:hypothetical protein
MIIAAIPPRPAIEFVVPRPGEGPESRALEQAFRSESLDFIKSKVVSLPSKELRREDHGYPSAKNKFSVVATVASIKRGKALPSDPTDETD